MPPPTVVVALLFRCVKTPNKQLEGGASCGSQFEEMVVGKAWQCGHEPTGHMASAFEREDERDVQLSLLSSVQILQQDVTRLLSGRF